MQHKISSCYVVSKNAWAKYRKRYRKQWEHDPLFQGLYVSCTVVSETSQFVLISEKVSTFFFRDLLRHYVLTTHC